VSAAVVGLGTIGSRVADAIILQPDIDLAGVAIRHETPAARTAAANGVPLFSDQDLGLSDLTRHGAVVELLGCVDVVVDCTPRGSGARNLPRYRQANLLAICCGGERHEDLGFTFSTFANYSQACGRQMARVASCNTTGLVRILAALHRGVGATSADVTLVRSVTDRDQTDGATLERCLDVCLRETHHARDLRLLLPHLSTCTAVVAVPTVGIHIAFVTARVGEAATEREVLELLASTPRVIVDETSASSAVLRPHTMTISPEVVVFKESVQRTRSHIRLAAAIQMEAVTIPETIDCIRALAGVEESAAASARLTDEALEISRPQWSYTSARTGHEEAARL
jgi:glyceraldehyde-3-phosphate dehydrogenase (NAD(P))